MPIYLNTQGHSFKNIKELIIYGFDQGHVNKFVPTYHDQACTVQECHSARRSFEDLLEICKTYFAETTPKQLARTLYAISHTPNALPNKPNTNIRPFRCWTICKMVFTTDSCAWEESYEGSGRLGKRNNNENSPYCYNDIMYLLIDFANDQKDIPTPATRRTAKEYIRAAYLGLRAWSRL